MKRLSLLFLLLVVSGCARIGPGYVGIKISLAGSDRGVQDIPASTGWVFYSPMSTEVFEYPTFVQQVTLTQNPNEGSKQNDEITFTNHDQMTIAADISFAYHLDPAAVPKFYVKFRNDDLNAFTHGYLKSTIRDKFNDIGGKYTIEQIMGDNGPFLKAVRDAVQADVITFGVIMEPQFGFIGAPRPPVDVIKFINMKVQANQIAQQKQNELVQAQADAAKKVAETRGKADSILLEADAQARANRELAESITPNLLELKRLEKWNGVLPTVSGGGAIPMFTVK